MCAFIAPFPVAPIPQSQTLGELLSKLPEEIIIQILEYSLVLPGVISKKDFWGGKCEWPGCLCADSDWEHTPGEELTNNTLAPLLSTPDPIPRLAQYVFYKSNTFHICDPRSDMDWVGRGVWLPPQDIRRWIRRLEIEIFIEDPRLVSVACEVWRPGRDVEYLRQMQRAVKGFTELRTLRLMFETAFVTNHDMLETIDGIWSTLEHFRFQTPQLVLEACSAFPAWYDDTYSIPAGDGDSVRDVRLERLLAKYVSATGKMQCNSEKSGWIGAECHPWQGKL
ncbi:uncharacterized protein M421DRAFT_144880 [Didymella exigua CBS 183.55]|uniref:Uncharacterized protein n=1 Tax=Didymella exigua CBS 183.55 TaxID=1150837 RepID=A0A6A5RPQ1_9PLEO|nr:uncharacterized protein M421DRAFT_144880 [Didymella exigua CBS 183.55]KAF1929024.1 hypothetical protein M421DRAFT_144880 [Didymella exigua CBS 183.55]